MTPFSRLLAALLIPLALTVRPTEEDNADDIAAPIIEEVEVEATHLAQVGARQEHITVNAGAFALLDLDKESDSVRGHSKVAEMKKIQTIASTTNSASLAPSPKKKKEKAAEKVVKGEGNHHHHHHHHDFEGEGEEDEDEGDHHKAKKRKKDEEDEGEEGHEGHHHHSKGGDDAEGAGAGDAPKREKTAKIDRKFLEFLFHLLDADTGGFIDNEEWGARVKGPWGTTAGPMWKVLSKGEEEEDGVSMSAFLEKWEASVDAAFHHMGGDLDNAEGPWKGAAEYEKHFIKEVPSALVTDGPLTGDKFEKFLYTAMVFHAIDANCDGTIDWSEFQGNPVALAAFGGADIKEQYHKYFVKLDGTIAMHLGDLLHLEHQNKAFTEDNPAGGDGDHDEKTGGSKEGEGGSKEDEKTGGSKDDAKGNDF